MKLIMTREEVEALLINTINQKLGTEFNKCEIETYQLS